MSPLPLRALAFIALAAFAFTACDSADVDPDPDPVTLTPQTVADLAADPTTGRDPDTGQPISFNRFTFFSFENGIVLNYDEENRADSNSTAWDIAFRGTEVIANGGASGPGMGGIQVLEGTTFDEVMEAPQSGYADALDAGTGNSWYNYDPATFIVTPIPGRVLVVRTAEGDYAKLRILSYYEGNPDPIDPMANASRYYTFEYVYQPDGSRGFEVTNGGGE